jgi:integrase
MNHNPAARIKKFKSTPEEERRKEEDEENLRTILLTDKVRLLLDTTKRDDPALLPYIAILFFAGLRPEREAAGVRWQDVLFDDGLLHVRSRKAKDRQARYIPMPDNLVAWLKLGGDLPTPNLRPRWEEARKKCELFGPNAWPHDAARHTFASNYLALHGAQATIEALGHGDYTMLFQHYRSLVKPDDAKGYFELYP